jgi:uncharacterized membrane-anchored protein YhcB (DUF1043 family)
MKMKFKTEYLSALLGVVIGILIAMIAVKIALNHIGWLSEVEIGARFLLFFRR